MTDFKSRKKDIAWIVSHCETESHREDYVNALKNSSKLSQNSLKVDIFGKCGDLEVPHRDPKTDKSDVDAGYRQIAKDYKFYLSLENSLCTEYVTEKFFNALKYGILPIVNGGLSKRDYAKIAPPHSYLHINDFNSAEDLMKTLENLAENQDLYNSYFWWKEHYTIETNMELQTQCQLCDILNQEGFKSENDYSQFSNYWNQCLTP